MAPVDGGVHIRGTEVPQESKVLRLAAHELGELSVAFWLTAFAMARFVASSMLVQWTVKLKDWSVAFCCSAFVIVLNIVVVVLAAEVFARAYLFLCCSKVFVQ